MTYLSSVTILSDKIPRLDAYPFNLSVVQSGGTLPLRTPVTYFVGENGSGKSTFLKSIANRCNIYRWQGMQRQRSFSNRYENALCNYLDISWSNGTVPGSYFDSEVFNNFAQILDEWAASDPGVLSYFGGESLMTKSHGQCNMTFFRNRFNRKGLYLLDEPETALSPRFQLEFLDLLRETAERGKAQYIISTHSPILLSHPGATIYSFDQSPVEEIAYEKTELYTVYKEFLNARG